jgi:hypothetical protein
LAKSSFSTDFIAISLPFFSAQVKVSSLLVVARFWERAASLPLPHGQLFLHDELLLDSLLLLLAH